MGKGFYSKRLNGQCYVQSEACFPFDSITCHVMCDTRLVASPASQQSAYYLDSFIPTNFTHGVSGYPYNATEDETKVYQMPNYFVASDLDGWKQRTVSYFGYPYTLEGPTYNNPHCAIGLAKRASSSLFQGRTSAYFTDAQESNRYNHLDEYLCTDWLGFLTPGGYIYTPYEIPEPMLCNNFFESGGWVNDLAANKAMHYNVMEFNTHIPTYQDKGCSVLLGNYVGLCFIPFFGECAIKNPIGNLPTDPSIAGPPFFKVDPSNQFVSLDLWVYLLAKPEAGKDLLSPKITSIRGWVPKSDITSSPNASWCSKYMYLTFKATDGLMNSFAPRISFCTGSGSQFERRVTLSNFKAYVTA